MPEQVPDNSGVRFPPPLVYAGLFLAGYGVHRLVPVQLIPGAGWTRWAGWGLVVAGIALIVLAVAAFVGAGVSPDPTKSVPAVVSRGPFRLTRNPMYLSLATVYLGVTLLVNSLWPLVLFPPVVWIVSRSVIAREEAYLERKFGPAYLEYKARVRRWL